MRDRNATPTVSFFLTTTQQATRNEKAIARLSRGERMEDGFQKESHVMQFSFPCQRTHQVTHDVAMLTRTRTVLGNLRSTADSKIYGYDVKPRSHTSHLALFQ